MKLLFILPEFHPETGGGICTYYTELFKENQKNGNWNVTVIQGSGVKSRGGGKTSWGEIPIHYLQAELLIKYKKQFKHFSIFPELQNHLASSWAIYELAQQLNLNFDAVVTVDWGFGFVPWIIKQQTPVIVHLHGSVGQVDIYDPRPGHEFWGNLYLQIETTLLSHADALVTHSNQNITFWQERLFTPQRILLVPPAIVNAYHSFTRRNNEFDKSIGLVVGRIQIWKGVVQLCEAINLINKEKLNKLKIYWIGRDTFYSKSGTSMSEYLSNTYPHIWNKIIEPIGPKDHDEIEKYYEIAKWTLVPSTWDMFNLSAVEHLLHKKPLVCSTGAGASDFLSHPSISIFDNTPHGLALEIEKLLELNNSS